MNNKIVFRPPGLQQQPRRRVNQQQQQSSGSGEFQPVSKTWPAQTCAGRPGPSDAGHDGAELMRQAPL